MKSFRELLLKPIEVIELFKTNKTSLYNWEKEGLIKSILHENSKYYPIESLRYVAEKKKVQKPKNKIQVFGNIKGGVGKSTLSAQYLMFASMLGLKCLAIDLDAQSHLSYQLGVELRDDIPTIYDSIIDNTPISKSIISLSETLDIIPGSLRLSTIEMPLMNMRKREFRLKNNIEKLKDSYDLIVADTNPAITMLNLNMYLVSDLINIVCATDYLSYSGLKLMLDQLYELRGDFDLKTNVKIIPNLYDHRNGICQRALGSIREHYQEFISKTIIRENTSLRDATQLKNSILFVKRKSTGKEDLLELTRELISS